MEALGLSKTLQRELVPPKACLRGPPCAATRSVPVPGPRSRGCALNHAAKVFPAVAAAASAGRSLASSLIGMKKRTGEVMDGDGLGVGSGEHGPPTLL